MYSRTSTINSTNSFSQQIDRLLRELDTAEAVVVGAGAGLSAAAGFTYGGERFREHFSDFEARYGFHDMYTGGFHHYDSKSLKSGGQEKDIHSLEVALHIRLPAGQ